MRTQPIINPLQQFHLHQPECMKVNGIPLYVLRGGDQEMIHLQLVVPAGRWFESLPLQASFTSKLLKSGTLHRNAFELVEEIDFYGAGLSISASYDYTTINIVCLTKFLAQLLPVVTEILTQSTFPEHELQEHKSRFLQSLKVNLEKTDYLAQRKFQQKLFGKNHPYGYAVNEQMVSNLTSANLHSFFYNNISINHGFAMIAGNAKPEHIHFIQEFIQKLSKQTSFVEEKHQVNTQVGVFHQLKPNAQQTSIRLGCTTISQTHKDSMVLQVLITALGGYFGSRLMQNLREEKGMTYGVQAVFSSFLHQGYVMIATDVGKEHGMQAIEQIKLEIHRLQQEMINDDELQLVKNYLVGQYLQQIDGPFAQSKLVKSLILNNQTVEDFTARIQSIQNISSEQLIQAANHYLQEDQFVEVAV